MMVVLKFGGKLSEMLAAVSPNTRLYQITDSANPNPQPLMSAVPKNSSDGLPQS
jgi:hypothetical protein